MIDKSKITGRCPFCGGKMEGKHGFYGGLYFYCQNDECGACVSFPTSYTNDADALRRFRRRAVDLPAVPRGPLPQAAN